MDDLGTCLIAIHDWHVEVHDDGIEVIGGCYLHLWLLIDITLIRAILLTNLVQIVLNSYDRQRTIDCRLYLDVLVEGAQQLLNDHQLKGLVIDDQELELRRFLGGVLAQRKLNTRLKTFDNTTLLLVRARHLSINQHVAARQVAIGSDSVIGIRLGEVSLVKAGLAGARVL